MMKRNGLPSHGTMIKYLAFPCIAIMVGVPARAAPSQTNQFPSADVTPAPAGTRPHNYSARYLDQNVRIWVAPLDEKADLQQIIVQRHGRPDVRVALQMHIGDVSKIARISADRVVMILTSTAPYAGVAIFDLTRDTFIDSFACYDPTISPDGHFVAYKKFYPPHFADSMEAYSDFELIYDLRKSADENLDQRRLTDGPQSPNAGVRGLLVYPKTWDLRRFPKKTTLDITYEFPTFYFWSPDSTKLFFLAIHYPAGSLPGDEVPGGNIVEGAHLPLAAGSQLVMVDVSSGKPTSRVVNARECGLEQGENCGIVLRSLAIKSDAVIATFSRTLPIAYPAVTKSFYFREFVPL